MVDIVKLCEFKGLLAEGIRIFVGAGVRRRVYIRVEKVSAPCIFKLMIQPEQ